MMSAEVKAALERLSARTDSSLHEFRDAIIEELCYLTDSKIAYFYGVDLSEQHLTLLGYSKAVMEACQILNRRSIYNVNETGLWGDAIRERAPVITNDYETTTRSSKRGLPQGHVPVSSHMNLPIFEGERIVAIVGVGNKSAPYTLQDAYVVEELMNGIWVRFQEALWETAM